jgi:electron transfer flavoprotein beta subunit
MNILVCLKQILDPDIPARDFRIDPEKKEATRGVAELVTNIFCENALETALQLRDKSGGRITVISYGSEDALDTLKKALAMKADEAVLVESEGAAHPDPLSVAQVLGAAAKKLGGFDLVLVGRESGDWGVGQTGGLLAEELGLPFVALVDQVEAQGDGVRLRRQTDVGFEVVEASGAVVISITNSDGNLPRIPKTRDIMKSARKPITRLQLGELGVDVEAVQAGTSYYEVTELSVPEKESRCEMVEGESLDERVDAFARRVAEIMTAAS